MEDAERDVEGGNRTRQDAWRTSWRIAHIYESRDFSTMPILGDALMDAGCEHELIQEHFHTTKPHRRGCWLVDLIVSRDR